MISHWALQALQALLMSNCRPAQQPALPAASARLSCARLSLAQGAGPPAASFEKRRCPWGAASQGWSFGGGAARKRGGTRRAVRTLDRLNVICKDAEDAALAYGASLHYVFVVGCLGEQTIHGRVIRKSPGARREAMGRANSESFRSLHACAGPVASVSIRFFYLLE